MGYYNKIDPNRPVGQRCSVYDDTNGQLVKTVEGYFSYFNSDYYMLYLPNNPDPTRRAVVYRAREVVDALGNESWQPVAPELILCKP
ncbi:MAG: hypothetical protein LM517_07640 [Nitrosomonas sp.]|nr:hypothetical protein [Nitrosomonas sp.]